MAEQSLYARLGGYDAIAAVAGAHVGAMLDGFSLRAAERGAVIGFVDGLRPEIVEV